MFNDRFVQLLQKKNMTGYRLAKITGLSQGLISDYKSGRCVPSAAASTKIAEALGITVDELLGRDSSTAEVQTTESDAFSDLFASLSTEDQMEIVRLMLDKKNKK
ncbi:MAG: helix-turn-helix transcriptional regulator [Clostridia bacterium]|nr:helix-turn-helix transcriptional regulator [Clostridia bacterium]